MRRPPSSIRTVAGWMPAAAISSTMSQARHCGGRLPAALLVRLAEVTRPARPWGGEGVGRRVEPAIAPLDPLPRPGDVGADLGDVGIDDEREAPRVEPVAVDEGGRLAGAAPDGDAA